MNGTQTGPIRGRAYRPVKTQKNRRHDRDTETTKRGGAKRRLKEKNKLGEEESREREMCEAGGNQGRGRGRSIFSRPSSEELKVDD